MTEQRAKTNMDVLESWGEYIEAVKEDIKHNKVTSLRSTEICDRCGEFLWLVLKDGEIKYFCPQDKISVGWEAVALRGLR